MLIASTMGVGVASAQAPEFQNDAGIRVSAGHSDNIFRAPTDEESVGYRALGLFFNSQRRGGRLTANLNGDIDVREYSAQNIDSEPVGTINAAVGVDVVRERLAWVFNENYGQGTINPFRPGAPNNRQEINIFSTGPRLTLPLGARTTAQLSATEARRRFDNTVQLDSDSTDFDVTIFRAIRTTTSLGLILSTRDIKYEDPTLDWEVDTVALSYQRQLASGAASLSIGRNESRLGNLEVSNPNIGMSWSRQLGSRTQLTLSARRSHTDPGDGFVSGNLAANISAIGSANVFLAAGVFDLTEFTVATSITYERSSLGFSIGIGESDYLEDPTFDNDQLRFDFFASRELSESLSIGGSLAIFDREYVSLGQEDKDRYSQIWLLNRFTRRFSLQVSYRHNTRQGASINPYEENVAQISLQIDLNP